MLKQKLKAYLDAAKTHVEEIEPAQLLASKENYLMLDVRETAELSQGKVDGSIHIPRGLLEFQVIERAELADQEVNIVVYCQLGGRSLLAAKALQDLGYTRVRSLKGGFKAFQEAQ